MMAGLHMPESSMYFS